MPIARVSADGGNGRAADASSTWASTPRDRSSAAAVWPANCELPMPSSSTRRALSSDTPASGPPGSAYASRRAASASGSRRMSAANPGCSTRGLSVPEQPAHPEARRVQPRRQEPRRVQELVRLLLELERAQQRRVELQAGVRPGEDFGVRLDAALLGALDPGVDV